MLAFAFVSYFVTETKGRSLEEIEGALQQDTPSAIPSKEVSSGPLRHLRRCGPPAAT